jgi:16S rRNA (guanine966-N2)-methyltransferase
VIRVNAGRFRSRLLKTVPGLDVRPTSDRLRQTLFNILAPRLEGAVFLDAYAGSGGIGIEALSRGASRAIFIEHNRAALAVIRENLATLNLAGEAQVVAAKVTVAIGKYPADIVFLDPPYPLEREYRATLEQLGESAPPLVVAQHSARFQLAEQWGKLKRTRLLKQGDNALSFFEAE